MTLAKTSQLRSSKNFNYLDAQVINNNGIIETDLYTKPTDKHNKYKWQFAIVQWLRITQIFATIGQFVLQC